MGFWESLYSTLRLFVFERDEEFPESRPLIFIFFAAPLIALSAAGAAVTYLFRLSPQVRLRWLSDHVVVCGVGRAGKLIAGALCERGVPVVGIDRGPPEAFDDFCAERRTPMLFGDFHSRALLARAGADRARSVIFASGDDLANLEGAVGAYERLRSEHGPTRLIWAHIANERLADTARLVMRTSGRVGIRFFDTYRIAASRMIARYFSRGQRRGIREVNILGFGKFGRDLLEVLVRDLADDEPIKLRVIDVRNRANQVRLLAEELGVSERVSFCQADINELALEDQPDKAFFLCTDDDLGNLTAAMVLASRSHATHIYVRMAHWPLSAVAEHLGESRGVVFVNINDLVVQGLADLPGVFQPAQESDLKRRKLDQ